MAQNDGPFAGLERNHYAVILADPPWHFRSWADNSTKGRWNGNEEKPVYTQSRAPEYKTMSVDEIAALPVSEIAAPDCVLFLWGIWVNLPDALRLIEAWGFTYKTCAFNWVKAEGRQVDMFRDDINGQLGLGYWVRQNSEFCLLATRGKPKRLKADVRQAIIEPRRQHSRKPDCCYGRIERLVAGPYIELFARAKRPGWDSFGNEVGKYHEVKQ